MVQALQHFAPQPVASMTLGLRNLCQRHRGPQILAGPELRSGSRKTSTRSSSGLLQRHLHVPSLKWRWSPARWRSAPPSHPSRSPVASAALEFAGGSLGFLPLPPLCGLAFGLFRQYRASEHPYIRTCMRTYIHSHISTIRHDTTRRDATQTRCHARRHDVCMRMYI